MAENPRIVRIEKKVDGIKDDIGSINVTLASQHESLKEHMRRTDILETKLEPLERHVDMVHGIFKFLGLIAAVGAIIEALIAVLGYFK